MSEEPALNTRSRSRSGSSPEAPGSSSPSSRTGPPTSGAGSEEPRRLLIVDDDAKVREAHRRLAESLGYETEIASDGIEALAKLPLGFDLVLLDGQMPNMDGFDVARRIRDMPDHEFLPIIMVTGLVDPEQHRRALEVGVNDFIHKPMDRDLLHLRSKWLLDLKRAYDRLSDHKVDLERSVAESTRALREALADVTESRRRIRRAHLDTIRRLTVAAELKDTDTGQHIERIGVFSRLMARAMGMSPGEAEMLYHAAPMHDVGKMAIPDRILMKPGRLDDDEWAVMQTHTTAGARILSGSESEVIQMGETIARWHHERWDGSGYPDGLTGDHIPLPARICAVVDFFDALTMDRPYREAVPVPDVIEMMVAEEGGHFDPAVLQAFFAVKDEILRAREGSLGDR